MGNRNLVRIFFYLTALLVLGVVFFVLFRPQPVAVDLAQIGRGPLAVGIEEEGRTQVREVYTLSAPVGGRLLRIERHAGDPVSENQTVIATIQPNDPDFLDVRARSEVEALIKSAEAARQLAQAEVSGAKAELVFAEEELTRARKLAEGGHVSQSSLDRTTLLAKKHQAALDTTYAALRVRNFELQWARAMLIEPGSADVASNSCCVIVKAPVSGSILRVLQESQKVVAAGTPLVEIGDPADLEIVTDLLSSDAVRVSIGDRVIFEDWGGEKSLEGRVRRIEPYGYTKVSALGIEEQRVNVMIDLISPHEDWRALGHGYRLDTRIIVWSTDDALKAPIGALFRDGGVWAVFVEDGGVAALRPVRIGHIGAREAEILDGLAAGDRVILHPSDQIDAGTNVVQRGG